MARLSFTLTVLFFLFAFTSARIPSDLPEDVITDRDLSGSLPESDTKSSTILLPSEKLESEEPTTVVELEPETAETKTTVSTPARLDIDTDAKAIGTTEDLPVSDRETVTVPLDRPMTIVRFRPINRHFPVKRSYPSHIPLRGCHHGIKHMMKHRAQGHEVSYGNDMILAGEGKDFDPEMIRGGVRQIPARWMRFHHRHHHDGMPKFPFGKHHHDMFGKKSFRRPFHGEEEEEEREEKEGREEGEKGGFMKRFRKFLNHF